MVYVVHVGDSRAIFCSADSDIQLSAEEKKLSEDNGYFNRVALKLQKLRSFTRKSDEEINGAVIQSEDMSLSGRMRMQRGYEVGGSNFHFRGHGLSIQVENFAVISACSRCLGNNSGSHLSSCGGGRCREILVKRSGSDTTI